jgi:hypothetical protein
MPTLNTVSITWDEQDRPVITVSYHDREDDAAAAAGVDVNEWLEALVTRLTDESAERLRALIDANNAHGPTSLADLAEQLGVDKKKIDGWNRNFGRSVKAVVRDYGFLRKDQEDGTAQVFDFEWDNAGNRWLYIVPEKYRNTLIEHLDAS